MTNEISIVKVIEYRKKYITIYSDETATVSGMKYPDIKEAKKAIDKILAVTKINIG